jgi:hypothetical protein
VLEWNRVAVDAIRVAQTPPPIAARALAILHVAIYDAVNGIARTHEPYLVTGSVPASASKEAAASAAARRVLMRLFPSLARTFDSIDARIVAGLPGTPQTRAGRLWGEFVADATLAARMNDNSDTVIPPPNGSGPGAWVRTPDLFASYALPQWGFVAPFVMPVGAHFRPAGPPPLESDRYARDYDEVKALGAAMNSDRTAEQSKIALFWADGPGTETPPGHWNSIARSISAARGMTLEQSARLFALLNVAMADAAICAWDAKYLFDFWRPVTAIRQGDHDGNPATTGDTAWRPLLATPPFPDYVSGHSTFSGAASRVLARILGSDAVAFSTSSDSLPGVTRRFTTLSDAAAEATLSRVYGGIHFRSAGEDGLLAGQQIADWAFMNYMRPKRDRSRPMTR